MGASDLSVASVVIADRNRAVAEALRAVVQDLGAHVAAVVTTRFEAISACKLAKPLVALVDPNLFANQEQMASILKASDSTKVVLLCDEGTDDATRILDAMNEGAAATAYRQQLPTDLHRTLLDLGHPGRVIRGELAEVLLHTYAQAVQERQTREVRLIQALAAAADVRDPVTGGHLQRVEKLASGFVDEVAPELTGTGVDYGFTLHDIGKIGVPDQILNKPGPLTDAEWKVMKTHPTIGAELVRPLGLPECTTMVVSCHHERWDGHGYPHGLAGEDIPLGARIFAIADAYDAMTSARPYRPPLAHSTAMANIRKDAGSHFDPNLAVDFESWLQRRTQSVVT